MVQFENVDFEKGEVVMRHAMLAILEHGSLRDPRACCYSRPCGGAQAEPSRILIDMTVAQPADSAASDPLSLGNQNKPLTGLTAAV